MAHEVTLDLATTIVLRKDATFEIKKDGRKLGLLLISRGNIEWVPAGNHVNKKRLSWENFAALMEENGKNSKIK